MLNKEVALAAACSADKRNRMPQSIINQLYVTHQGDIVTEQEANCMLIAQYATQGMEVIARALRLS